MMPQGQSHLEEQLKVAGEAKDKGSFADAEQITLEVLNAVKKEQSNTVESGKIQSEAVFLLAEIERLRGNHTDALEYADKLLNIANNFQLLIYSAKAWNIIGLVQMELGNFDKSLEYLSKAASAYKDLKDESGAAVIMGSIGNVHQNLGNYDLALDYMVKALSVHEELAEKSRVARVMGDIGVVHSYLSNYSNALEYFFKALAAYEELNEIAEIARITGNIGNVYKELSDYARAFEYMTKAVAMFEKLDNKEQTARFMGNIGRVYNDIHDYTNALYYFQKVLAVYEELGMKELAASITGTIGTTYANISDYALALEYMGKALKVHQELGAKLPVAIGMNNMGTVYQKLSEYPRSLECYGKSLALYEELGNKRGISISLGNIGIMYANEAFEGYDTIKAEEYLLKSLAMSDEFGWKREQYEIHQELAAIYEKQERWREHSRHFKLYKDLEKEVQSAEVKKQAERLEYERISAEREKELAIERTRSEERGRVIRELTQLNRALEEANREKNEVIGIVAHDLKNPLAGIMLAVKNFRRFSLNMSTTDVEKLMDRMAAAAGKMTAFIDNLLDIQRLDEGRYAIEIVPVSVKSAIESSILAHSTHAAEKQIRIITQIPIDEIVIAADSIALSSIIDNLLSNALKFSPLNSNILVKVTQTALESVSITIQDEGPGLTEEDKKKMFGKFMRLSARPTSGEHSTGLGLSIVKKLVEEMSGTIRCDSELGKGAAFTVEFKLYGVVP